MINLARFQTVRARLLALMAYIVIPIATLSIILATTTYRSVTRSIELSQTQAVSNYAVRARVWFRGSLRALVAAAESVRAAQMDGERCTALARNVIDTLTGFQAIRIETPGLPACYFSRNTAITSDIMDQLTAEHARIRPDAAWAGPTIAEARYGAVKVGTELSLIVNAQRTRPDGTSWNATLFVDTALMDQVFEIGRADAGAYVALMKKGQHVVSARSAAERRGDWLPETEEVSTLPRRWPSRMPAGTSYVYATQLVTEPDLYVLARFDNGAADAAFYQFLVLCITPLATLLLLFITYARAIQFDIVAALKGIETAARARKNDPQALVPLNDSMPADIRLVAESFNTMVLDGNKREEALRQSVDANQFLLRELNHRVKNSLQVIQSYLALSRRQKHGQNRIHFAETEAMVQVMSTAYRLALNDGTMRPVAIRPFIEEIIGNLSSSLRRPDQWIDARLDVETGLVIDRIIPLGLGIVEAVISALRAPGAAFVRVRLETTADGRINVQVATDAPRPKATPPSRIMTGLAVQLDAEVGQGTPDSVLDWTFHA